MKKLISVVLILVTSAFEGLSYPDIDTADNIEREFSADSVVSYYSLVTSEKYLLSPVFVKKKDGEVLQGNFLGLVGKELHIMINKEIVIVNIKNVYKIGIEYLNNRVNELITGFGMASYISGLFFQNANYSENTNWPLIRNDEGGVFFLMLGSGFFVSSIIYALSKNESNLVIKPGELHELDEDYESELRKLLADDFVSKKLNFKFQFGNISPRLNEMQGNGVMMHPGDYYSNGYYGETPGNYNLLRSMNISYSIAYDYEVGLSYYNLCEPSKSFGIGSLDFSIDLDNKVYLLTGTYHPYKRSLPQIFDLAIGCGVGFADIFLNYNIQTFENNHFNQEKAVDKETSISGLLFMDVGLRLSNSLSCGISADMVIIPGSKGLPETEMQKATNNEFSLTSYFFGFYMKYSFVDYF